MSNGQTVEAFAKVFLLAPELARQALSEQLPGYKITFEKTDINIVRQHPDPYQFPLVTGERSVATM